MAKGQKFSLNIHHRSIRLSTDSTRYTDQKLLAGHFYIGLEREGKEIFFNKYPIKVGFLDNLIDSQIIKSELIAVYGSIQAIESYKLIQCITTNIIPLTAAQFAKAYTYVVDQVESKIKTSYTELSGNADYVQSVYHAAGLPLYFTTIYTKNELKDLHTHAAKYVLLRYGSRDTLEQYFHNVSAENKEELAQRLNINKEAITPLLITKKSSKYCFFSVSLKDVILPYKQQFSNIVSQEALISPMGGGLEIPLPYPVPHQFFAPGKNWCDIIPIALFYMTSKFIISGPSVMKTEQMKYWLEMEKTYEAELYLNFIKFNEFIKVDEIASRVSTDIVKFREKFVDLLVTYDSQHQQSIKIAKKENVTFFKKLKQYFTKKSIVPEVSPEEHRQIEEQQIEKIQLYNKIIHEINERFNQVTYEAAENFNFLALTAQGRLPDCQIAALFNIKNLTQTFLQGVIKDLDLADSTVLLE
ncbi:hypothetical protein [Candidatus Tisiphia endosymbiont of Nemotelus uliginosus]|uniref:hypothetical protein n=1 Tax=Candidatus Tisiphia endosymbiont of Nemotelus uliginosus TaxID=3077926 RepID=UPI0035C882EF